MELTCYMEDRIKGFISSWHKFSLMNLTRLNMLYSHMQIHIYIYLQNESQRHSDKRRAKTSLEKYVPLNYCKVCVWEGVGDRTNCNIWTPTLMAVSVVSFSFSSAAQPEAQGPTLLAFSITSYQQLLWTPTYQGPQGPHRPGVAFPTTSRL